MTTREERISLLERDIVNEMRAGFERLDAKIDNNHKWTIGLLITMLIAIIIGFAGIIAAIISG